MIPSNFNKIGVEVGTTSDRDHTRLDIAPLDVPIYGWIWKRPQFLKPGAAALEKALFDELGGVTMGDVWRDRGIGLAIPAVEMSRHHAWVFKTPHLANTQHRDDGYLEHARTHAHGASRSDDRRH